MKNIILLLLFCSLSVTAQKRLKEYKASNGITYTEGDTIAIGRGSGGQGSFVHYQMGGWMAGGENPYLPSSYNNSNAVIKKIKEGSIKGAKKVWFTVDGGNITNYNLFIEEAIQTCEVKDCTGNNDNIPATSDKYDQIKKAKKLLDDGIITQEEFDKEKKRLLE